jgi:hypothetical protein
MGTILVGFGLLAAGASVGATDGVYEGTWVTTNRRLDGPLRCVVTDLGRDRWRGRFSGSWNGQPFAYEVDFRGPPDQLRGRAVIDGAEYEWTGELREGPAGWFRGEFGGSRYKGYFRLKQKDK